MPNNHYIPNRYRKNAVESFPKYYLNNAIVLNTRCVQVFRARLGRERLTDEEYDLCDVLGDEIARLLPHDFKISKLEAIPPERIVEWAEMKARHEEFTVSDLYEREYHEVPDNELDFTNNEITVFLFFIGLIMGFLISWIL